MACSSEVTFGPTSVQLKRLVAPRVPRKRHQMRHLCDFACFLAKQVLSQLSYTPIPMFLFILNQLRILAPLETVQTVPECAKSVPNKQLILNDCATVPDTLPNGVFISFGCRSSSCSVSLFICNFICEYFLK